MMMLGSCFATELSSRLADRGFDVCCNPFGVLYNPASIATSLRLLDSPQYFTYDDVICSQGMYTSFFHHSSFSRTSPEEFLENANSSLCKAAESFRESDTIVVTLGTAWVFRHIERGIIVSNCHKIHPGAFKRERLSVAQVVQLLSAEIEQNPRKRWIFTVSPIRHLKDTAHGNQLSKSTLLLATEILQQRFSNVDYFPSYEIMMDELRDYRFYCENMIHPTPQAVDYIFEKFVESAIDPAERPKMDEALRKLKASRHIPLSER